MRSIDIKSRDEPQSNANPQPNTITTCDKIWGLAIICFFIAVIVVPATVVPSFHYVRYDEYGFKRNVYGTVDTSVVLKPGRYFYTLNYDVVTLPATFVEVDFTKWSLSTLSVTSNEGIAVGIDIVFYFSLKEQTVSEVYNKYNINYKQLIINMARSVVKNVAANYNVNDFINQHKEIGQNMARELNRTVSENIGIEILPTNVFIQNINLPQSVTNQNLQSAIALQQNQAVVNQQRVDLIVANTATMVNEIVSNGTFILNKANFDANLIIENSKSQSVNILLTAKSQAIQRAITILQLNSSHTIQKFIEYMNLIDLKPQILLSDGKNLNSIIRS